MAASALRAFSPPSVAVKSSQQTPALFLSFDLSDTNTGKSSQLRDPVACLLLPKDLSFGSQKSDGSFVPVSSQGDAQAAAMLSQKKPYLHSDFSSRNHTLITKYLLKATSIVCIPSYFLA